MIPKQAVDVATRGGWKYHGDKGEAIMRGGEMRWKNNICTERIDTTEVALDHAFWRCLGNALGWNRRMMVQIFDKQRDDSGAFTCDGTAEWEYQAMRFYHMTIRGYSLKAFDDFWKELLT